MQLTHILIAAFAISANAQWQHPHRIPYQEKAPAQVGGSDYNHNAGSINASNPNSDPSTSTTTTGSSSSSSSNNPIGSTASFTQYSGCNSAGSVSCAWYSSTGYNAAISQAVYGGSTGSGASAACGVCWKLTPEHPGANEIVVKVNNLCPDSPQNPLCAQPADVDINFDLCQDSGAAAALFGSSGTEQVNGTAAIVDCGEWSGGADVY